MSFLCSFSLLFLNKILYCLCPFCVLYSDFCGLFMHFFCIFCTHFTHVLLEIEHAFCECVCPTFCCIYCAAHIYGALNVHYRFSFDLIPLLGLVLKRHGIKTYLINILLAQVIHIYKRYISFVIKHISQKNAMFLDTFITVLCWYSRANFRGRLSKGCLYQAYI